MSKRATLLRRARKVCLSNGISKKTLIEKAPAPPVSNGQELQRDAREHMLQDLFDTFDGAQLPSGVSDEAFHRENWYEDLA